MKDTIFFLRKGKLALNSTSIFFDIRSHLICPLGILMGAYLALSAIIRQARIQANETWIQEIRVAIAECSSIDYMHLKLRQLRTQGSADGLIIHSVQSHLSIKTAIFVCCTLLLFCTDSRAQWTKLGSWDKADISAIYFPKHPTNARVGFLAVSDRFSNDAVIWRTTNSGLSWETASPKLPSTRIAQFAFSDTLVGWAGGYTMSDEGVLLKTSDGGKSWLSIPNSPASGSLFYHAISSQLFSSFWEETPFKSSKDGGATWQSILGGAFIGISGDEDGNIVVSGDPNSPFISSADGVNWITSNIVGEAFQPCQLQGKFFTVTEAGPFPNHLFRSEDKGRTWQLVSLLPDDVGQATGMIESFGCNLIIQSSKGVFKSTDEGKNWVLLKDFTSQRDTRFFVDQNLLYVAQQGNTAVGGDCELWRYAEPVALSLPQSISLQFCQKADTLVRIDAPTCFQSKLLAVSIDPDNSVFSLGSMSLPATMDREFGVPLRFDPIDASIVNARMFLRFRVGAVQFDTAIALEAKTQVLPPVFGLRAAVTNARVEPHGRTVVEIYPDRPISRKDLSSIEVTATFDDDLFNIIGATSRENLTVGVATVMNGSVSLPLTITGNDLTLDPSVPIAEIELEARVADTSTTSIILSGLSLNGGNPRYCMLRPASTSGAVASVDIRCGESMIQRVLRNEQALRITSIKPNPANSQITVEWRSIPEEELAITLHALNGEVILVEKPAKLSNSVSMNTSSLPNGTYLLRLRSGSEETTGRFVIEK